ncbi:MAG: hypothetical protein HUU37_00715 [Bdellovibrionales bacterium]|nr:hypothetical protein [Bdellovibrionales bacterium]
MRGIFFAGIALLLAGRCAQANMGTIFGLGPKSMSTGATSFLQGDWDSFATFSAPAALGFLREAEVTLGMLHMDPNLKPFGTLVLNSNGTRGEFSDAGVLEGNGQLVGFAFPIGSGSRPFTIGGNFYLPSSGLVRVSGSPVNYPFYPMYSDISRNAFFVVGAGYRIWRGLALGVNLRSTSKSVAQYQLRSDNTINYSASAVEARSENRFSASLLYDHGLEHDSQWSLGAMYRARSSLETRLSADVSAFVPVQGELVSTPSYSPSEWVGAFSWRSERDLTVSTDVALVEWKGYTAPYGSGNINFYVIGDRGKQAGFKNVWVPRAGVQKKFRYQGSVRSLAIRGGGFYYPSPVPDQIEDSNYVDNDRWGATAGAGLGLKNPWREQPGDAIRVELAVQYNRLRERHVTKVASTNVGAPGYTTGGEIWIYGMSGTFVF